MTVIDFGKQPEEEKSTASNLLKAVGLTAAIVLGGAVGWAVIGFFSDSMYYAVPFLIGIGQIYVLVASFRPLSFIKGALIVVISIFSTVVSIALGEFFFTVAYTISEWDYTVGEAIYVALVNIVEIFGSVDAIFGYVLGAFGVIIGLISAIRENKSKGEQ